MVRILAKAAAVTAAAAGVMLVVAACSASGDPKSGTESLTLTTHSVAANPVYHAVATGVFSATGTMRATSTASNAPLKLSFPGGTFVMDKVTPGRQSGSVNPATCAAVYSITGATYKISNGTGSYKGIKGSGTANVKFGGRLPKLSNGKCDESPSAVPVKGTAVAVIHASGPVTLP